MKTSFSNYKYTTKKLSDHKYCQCHVVINNRAKEICFVSYNTEVIIIKTNVFGKRLVKCTGTYSATTRKQIGHFLKEYAPDLNYYDMKKIAGKKTYTIM